MTTFLSFLLVSFTIPSPSTFKVKVRPFKLMRSLSSCFRGASSTKLSINPQECISKRLLSQDCNLAKREKTKKKISKKRGKYYLKGFPCLLSPYANHKY